MVFDPGTARGKPIRGNRLARNADKAVSPPILLDPAAPGQTTARLKKTRVPQLLKPGNPTTAKSRMSKPQPPDLPPARHGDGNSIMIPVEQLEPGMYINELDRPWLESPFLFQGFPVNTAEEIEQVRRVCRYVFIDADRHSARKKAGRRPGRPRQSEQEKRDERARLQKAARTYQAAHSLIKNMMDDVRLGGSLDIPRVKEAVSECVDRVLQHEQAMTLLTRLKERDEYTSQHSLNVALLSIALGRHLGMERKQLEELGTCGMLHDIGKVHTPLEILNKPGRLTPDEFQIMKRHPTEGRDILLGHSGLNDGAISVAHAHHERIDGTGYPRGLTGDQTTSYTKIVSIVDAYDAITSERPYKRGLTSLQGLKILNDGKGAHFEPGYVMRFIQCIGLYPVGSVVELNSGEIGIVTKVLSQRLKTRPMVLVVRDAEGRPIEPFFINLLNDDPAPNGVPYRIRAMLRDRDLNLDICQFMACGGKDAA